jgi:hypothetical protein
VSSQNAWKLDICEDSCFDALSPLGRWEMVCVEEISPDHEQVRVTFSTGMSLYTFTLNYYTKPNN